MVIEHKTVIYPPNAPELWRMQHRFSYSVMKRLSPYFRDALYTLSINAESLRKTRIVVDSLLDEIVGTILAEQDQIRQLGRIRSKSQISWSFRRILEEKIIADTPQFGVIVDISCSYDPFEEEVEIIRRRYDDALRGISDIFIKRLQDTTKKFFAYPNAQRVMVVQFHTDESVLVTDEDVIKMIQETQIPPTIDEIWIANPEWISQEEFEIAYSRLYLASQNGSR